MPCHRDNGHVHGMVEESTDTDIRMLDQNINNIPTPKAIDTMREVRGGLSKFFDEHGRSFNRYVPTHLEILEAATCSVADPNSFVDWNPVANRYKMTHAKSAIRKLQHMVRSPLDRDSGRLCVT